MSISNSAFEQLLREYDEKQLAASRECRLRVQRIESEVPALAQINSRIAEMSVDLAVQRIRGVAADRRAYEERRDALIAQRDRLLREAGYSAYDLQPHYECSICKDTGYVENRKCRCLQSRIIDLLYDQSNIRNLLEKENFETYSFQYYSNVPLSPSSDETPLSIAKKAVSIAQDFVHHFASSSDNLFISGATGTGKTFLSNCIAKEVLDRGYTVIYLSAVKLFGILADNTFRSNAGPQQMSEDLYSCDLLIIDDLGTEYTNSFIQSAFFNCINERLLRNRHTIISTNLSMEQIGRNYSERVFSRIAERYTLIRLFGEDIRIIKKLEE